MKTLRHLWVFPFLVVVYIYGSEALGVFTGETEHFDILSGLGLGNGFTTAGVWLSVLIEAVIIAAALWKPSSPAFSIAALWPWVPRVITAATGADMNMMEMDMSLIASIASMAAYVAYEHFRQDTSDEAVRAIPAA